MDKFELIDATVPVHYVKCKACGSLSIGCAKTKIHEQTPEQKARNLPPKTDCAVVCGDCLAVEKMDFEQYLKEINKA